MWLNVLIICLAGLIVEFILGWVVARPRRWDSAHGRASGAAGSGRFDASSSLVGSAAARPALLSPDNAAPLA